MSFRDNLQYLRASRNFTQERLAMLLGVSRQAISKWESGKAYPEMDKLLMICDLFGCTLDDLVLGDVRRPGASAAGAGAGVPGGVALAGTASGVAAASAGMASGAVASAGGAMTGGPAVPLAGGPASEGAPDADAAQGPDGGDPGHAGGVGMTGVDGGSGMATAAGLSVAAAGAAGEGLGMSAPVALAQDITGYDAHVRSFAWRIAAGVAAIIAGVGLGVLFDTRGMFDQVDTMRDGLAFATGDFMVFLCIAAGVVAGLALIIPAGMTHAEFRRRHPYIEDFYTDDDRARASRNLAVGIVVGVGLIMAGVAVTVYGEEVLHIEDGWPTSAMLLCVAAGVAVITLFGVRRGLMDVDAYNRESESDRREREREASGGDFYDRLTGAVCGIIMLIATIVGLVLLFGGPSLAAMKDGDWEPWGSPATLFWLAWPIGGVLCGVAACIINIFRSFHDRDR
ncbi:helix-turn-helix transcriptional regulator [Bifidobacterium sp. 6T3]|uniref:Helix-turn-helix transcriptional regulator n=1 Tax=Bifidobacterium phasiani TaxID=2834431 RepID=A0ABS6WA68_9BIFI|nr:helix-turn-helix transcriptional regulator [Bifidobacterium phasiani]MBW3083393.1 helix-turn-helix transcriptional regulator [Bifidobacterium phasiani]